MDRQSTYQSVGSVGNNRFIGCDVSTSFGSRIARYVVRKRTEVKAVTQCLVCQAGFCSTCGKHVYTEGQGNCQPFDSLEFWTHYCLCGLNQGDRPANRERESSLNRGRETS